MRIHVHVGAAGSEDTGTFELTFYTPNRVGLLRDLRQISLFDGFAFANHFDLAILKQNISEACSELMGFTSVEAIAKFGRFARAL